MRRQHVFQQVSMACAPPIGRLAFPERRAHAIDAAVDPVGAAHGASTGACRGHDFGRIAVHADAQPFARAELDGAGKGGEVVELPPPVAGPREGGEDAGPVSLDEDDAEMQPMAGGSKQGARCTYTIQAGSPRRSPCEGGLCGGGMFVPVLRVVASGRCPPLAGQTLTEVVTDAPLRRGERGCGPIERTTGPGCVVDAQGFMPDCGDHYQLCGGIRRFPEGTCTSRANQVYRIGRRVVARNRLVFTINNVRRTTSEGFTQRCGGTFSYEPGPSMILPD